MIRKMSILRKEGKEKLHFKALNNKVTNSDFKRLKRLCLNCLDENPEISKILNENYRLIHVYFFYETRDKNVAESLKLVLDDQKVTFNSEPTPAISYSRKKIGCILVFLKHLEEITENRKDIQNFQAYKKNGLFEEFCHLAEQKGNSNFFPKTFWGLRNLYGSKGWLLYGNEVLAQLDTDRNHYEVFSMMLKAYPDDWVKRFSKYFSKP